MIKQRYTEDMGTLSIVINSKNIIKNISYKIHNDLNMQKFFNDFALNCYDFDKLDRIKKYDFVNDLKSVSELLNYLMRAMKEDIFLSKLSGKEILKPCRIFPENIGKRLLNKLAFIPLLNLIMKKNNYEKYFQKYIDLDEVYMGQTPLFRQREDLFEESIFRKTFQKDDDFINYKLRNKYVDFLKEGYGKEKIKLDNSMDILIKCYLNIPNEHLYNIGVAVWDVENKNDSKMSEELKEVFTQLSSAFGKKQMNNFKIAIMLTTTAILNLVIFPVLIMATGEIL